METKKFEEITHKEEVILKKKKKHLDNNKVLLPISHAEGTQILSKALIYLEQSGDFPFPDVVNVRSCIY